MNAWTCPTCGYSWAYWVSGCLNCNRSDHEKYSTGTGTNAYSGGLDIVLEAMYNNEDAKRRKLHEQITKIIGDNYNIDSGVFLISIEEMASLILEAIHENV